MYKTLSWIEDGDRNKFDKVLEAFKQFICSPQKNKHYSFWQVKGDAYLTRVRLKIDNSECNKMGWPTAVKAKITHNKFVFGLIDDTLKERLLREVHLTLE